MFFHISAVQIEFEPGNIEPYLEIITPENHLAIYDKMLQHFHIDLFPDNSHQSEISLPVHHQKLVNKQLLENPL